MLRARSGVRELLACGRRNAADGRGWHARPVPVRARDRLARPALRAGLAWLWRDDSTVQIGVDPQRAVVLGGLDPARGRLFEALDGSRDRAGLVHLAGRWGVGAAEVDDLLHFLDAHDLLDHAHPGRPASALPVAERARLAPDLTSLALVRRGAAAVAFRRRRAAWVDVQGGGRVGAGVASVLAAAGVGRVTVSDHRVVTEVDIGPLAATSEQVGERRGPAAARRLAAVAPSTATGVGADGPDVTVLAPDHGPDAALTATWLREPGVHLLAYIRETTGVVGPLVLPGRSACLRCVDLHRTDRDPAWPRLAVQLARPGIAVAACDVALATLVAASAALHVLLHIEGDQPPSVGASIETALADATSRRRPWPPHPACGCRWLGALRPTGGSQRA